MSVSDETAGGKPDWTAIKREYEATAISQRNIAKKYGVAYSTLSKRAMRENWSQRAKLVKKSVAELESTIRDQARLMVKEDLAPWIEEKKVEITKRGYGVADKGLTRIESLFRKLKPENPKAESESARAAETFLRMARTSLGMGDNTGAIGNLNVQILTNQAQIAVATQ